MTMRPRVGRGPAWWGLVALVIAACGGSSGAEAPSSAVRSTTVTTVPAAVQLPPSTRPEPKPTTTAVTTTTVVLPAGFPADLPVPEGNVGYFTGSPDLGYHLNISTALTYNELVEFFTDAIGATPTWELGVRDIGQGYLPGYEGLWAIYTAADHVITQLTGEYSGVIEIEQRHVNVLLDPLVQPEPGVEPELLPDGETLPRPDTEILAVGYLGGKVKITYAGAPDQFAGLVDAYRHLGWQELAVLGYEGDRSGFAVGDLAGWKVTVEEIADGLDMTFEDLALSYP